MCVCVHAGTHGYSWKKSSWPRLSCWPRQSCVASRQGCDWRMQCCAQEASWRALSAAWHSLLSPGTAHPGFQHTWYTDDGNKKTDSGTKKMMASRDTETRHPGGCSWCNTVLDFTFLTKFCAFKGERQKSPIN